MATIRKYAKPLAFRQGGRVPVLDDMPIADDAPAESDGFPSEILGDAPSTKLGNLPNLNPPAETASVAAQVAQVEEPNPLQRALDAQRRAEELQRSPIAREIDKLPLSEFKKQFLKHHPELVTDGFRSKALGFHHQQALRDGIEDDTPEMTARVLAGVDAELAHVRQQAIENVRMPAISEPEPDQFPPRALIPPVPAAPAPPLMPPPARRVPVSAPVSRDAPSYSGKPQSASTSVTLTAAERDIAIRSYSAPGMTDAEKELTYARNKLRLKRMRESGEYPEPERN